MMVIYDTIEAATREYEDRIESLRSQLTEDNELYLSAMNGLKQLQAELEAERKKVKRLVYGIRGIARDTESKAELGLRVDALLTELGEG